MEGCTERWMEKHRREGGGKVRKKNERKNERITRMGRNGGKTGGKEER